jgi:hypothetical protein
MSLTARLSVKVDAKFTQVTALAETVDPVLKEYTAILASGTGAGQADKFWRAQRTLAASANEDLDLNGATFEDAFGTALAFVKVKGLLVAAAAGNTNNVLVGGAAANGFVSWVGAATDKVVLRPGAFFMLCAGQADATGYAVTAATADLLRVANSAGGTSVTYDVYVVGTSA